ncbi:MAG: Swt1 family HEPN domain-containing protein [bacterium]
MKDERIKLFRMSHQMLESDLDMVEKTLNLDLGRELNDADDKDEEYYPQFPAQIRQEAFEMGEHYELFYCLEKSIRQLIEEKLKAEHGMNWWDSCVPDIVKTNVNDNIRKEKDAGFTHRSTKEIDYTNFGELGEIVRSNWDTFSDTFNSIKAFTKVMTNLNVLRAPIAHCSPLADDEVLRLKLSVKDWFRLME